MDQVDTQTLSEGLQVPSLATLSLGAIIEHASCIQDLSGVPEHLITALFWVRNSNTVERKHASPECLTPAMFQGVIGQSKLTPRLLSVFMETKNSTIQEAIQVCG